MKRWEYRTYLFEIVESRDSALVIAKLNSFGAEGWEVFKLERSSAGALRAWLKREVPPA